MYKKPAFYALICLLLSTSLLLSACQVPVAAPAAAPAAATAAATVEAPAATEVTCGTDPVVLNG